MNCKYIFFLSNTNMSLAAGMPYSLNNKSSSVPVDMLKTTQYVDGYELTIQLPNLLPRLRNLNRQRYERRQNLKRSIKHVDSTVCHTGWFAGPVLIVSKYSITTSPFSLLASSRREQREEESNLRLQNRTLHQLHQIPPNPIHNTLKSQMRNLREFMDRGELFVWIVWEYVWLGTPWSPTMCSDSILNWP